MSESTSFQVFNTQQAAVERHLKALGIFRKFYRWVPHQLTTAQWDWQILLVVIWYKNEPFLNHMGTGDKSYLQLDRLRFPLLEKMPSVVNRCYPPS
ncbi:hypothetical protein TNIN_455141 [Trichonephila inaurata madagascariensis]|uniref:Uncharacterized protein n=1 Tax=Trichonephila inaurata madagascariensis TaxID=2747483 RepID=A0A8X6IB89_9ARAC|nr:hypothetical protein TNIN_455141 [Trichonephila inaurata madagascariensis]